MRHLRLFEEIDPVMNREYDYYNDDRLEYIRTGCLANYGSRKDPKIGDVFTLSIRNSQIDNKPEYFLINSSGEELSYPYRKQELQIYFKKV